MARRRESILFLNACARALNAMEKMRKEKPKKLIEDIDEMAKSVIAQWYASYSPTYYGNARQRSLYHSYKLEQDGIDVEITFDSDYLSDYVHHQNNEIIFNNAFLAGYHGGSKSGTSNIPRWRTPYPTARNVKDGILPYTRWSEREVARSKSPYEQIVKEAEKLMDEYEDEWINDLEAKVLNPIKKSLSGLKRK